MQNFKEYAAYYNLIYKDKDYKREAAYCLDLLKKHQAETKNLLDLGCGTGKHDFIFAQNNLSVTGVDMSAQMIGMATGHLQKLQPKYRKKIQFKVSDIRTFNSKMKFDAVTSLFHVMSYQTANSDVEAVFETARKHLKPGGIFVFDFWYGPAVLLEQPEVRIKKFKNDDLEITRIATPEIIAEENTVNVRYHIFLKNCSTGRINEFEELHPMRYFFYPELSLWIDKFKFKMLGFYEWQSVRKPAKNSWAAVCVLKKL